MPRTRLTLAEARRVALAAQGFDRARPAEPPRARAVADVVRRLGVVQIDSVNVLTRAHYLPVFSRLGGYDRALLDAMGSRPPRTAFEYWGHEAALLPVSMHRLMRWRMQRVHDDAWGGMVRIQRDRPDLVAEVADVVRRVGPVTSTELESILEHEEQLNRDNWGWNWSAVKRALEFLFWSGEVTSAGRDSAFRRRYATAQRVLPRAALDADTPAPEQAQHELVLIAARAMGVATAADLADYFRMPVTATREAIGALVSSGELVEVEVPGWPTAYITPMLRVPRRVCAAALLGPFDPLIWFRPRTERLFGMRYRIGIYTPAAQRSHGYYVLPFLFREALVARVDLKADRRAGRLLVQSAHGEGAVAGDALEALADELARMADWLGLTCVHVVQAGDLAARLSGVVLARG